MLTKKVILVAESCGSWFLCRSFTGNRYVCAVCVCVDSLLVAFSGLQSECGDDGGVVWHDEAY